MKFDRLRLIGFKSFVEPTDVLIEPGLTGVVGPNGCGKSNLVEALRWVMGEASYKSVRGSSMDDVIFAGSGRRPTRDTAEVTLFLDNTARTAPAEINNADHLEVTRRINRGVGSDYRVNGKLVRARDVQLLFADAATGSRSPSMVRQGQVAELIAAKPTDRRNILEEAAGISGLRARKHEASLKLNAAEANLARVEDVAGEVERQVETLRRQAKQAARYRKISEEIRTLEATVHHLRWVEARAAVREGEAALETTATAQAQAAAHQERTAIEEAAAEHALPALRDAEAAAAAERQTLAASLAALDARDREITDKMASLKRQAEALAADLARQDQTKGDAAAAVKRLEAEEADLTRADAGAEERICERESVAEEAAAAAEDADARSVDATELAATALAARAALDQAVARAEGEVEKAAEAVRRTEAELARAAGHEAMRRRDEAAAAVALAEEAEAEAAAREAEAAEAEAEAQETEADSRGAEAEAADLVAASEAALAPARAAEAAAREALAAVASEVSGLETEAKALDRLTASLGRAEDAVLDDCTVEPGYEVAFAAALGDDLEAPVSDTAPARWSAVPPGGTAPAGADPALPAGATPLGPHVTAPPALARRLAQVGLVEDRLLVDGALLATLAPGQRLVTREGALWRWDGYARAAGAPSAAAERLAQKNRLAELHREIEALKPRREEAEAAIAEAQDGVAAAADADKAARETLAAARQRVAAARQALSAARSTLSTARGGLASARKGVTAAKERLAAADAAAKEAEAAEGRIAATLDAARTTAANAAETLAEAEAARDAASDGTRETDARDQAKAAAQDARRRATEAANAVDAERRASYGRTKRLERLAGELAEWRARLDGADTHRAELVERLEEISEQREALADAPSDTQEERHRLARTAKAAETADTAARDARAAGEARQRGATQAAREALAALSSAREAAIRAEERTAAARERLAEVEAALTEALDVAPAGAMRLAGLDATSDLPDRAASEHRLDRLKSERERLGGVNLCAEDELNEIETRQCAMLAERDDIVAAIETLRVGIRELNREARERLLASFGQVNSEFQRLFKRLFNGGEAELILTEAEDPLDAGLDIVARPPGKKPQVLSLLSGGEQTLTATALIFAVFLTNPAPICVLDEIDAPLDDANVERFCNLLDEMAGATETRFITITHNPITMARMHRLYGVTMVEKGVSQLVSVSLEAAEELRETA
ncbi:chromosome segregation protein SMC [Acuticoccus sp. I52.16.1]|uniref:chromosome segregation protein SMC n=1 Tax=Acuticoccus sp. I52.16.1 TaxID=2928472 RepID=UPI001FD4C3B2|nr:chromosome segregation protein SMC [Acuticoccus sp. I52.16.1]UOM33723.1 chromosome segregation protein SMC [Acuticoccus sp. I52.16.1]